MLKDRIGETDILKPALKIIQDNPGINMSKLIKELENIVELSEYDKKLLNNRQDSKFSQIVRNLVSHISNNEFGKCVNRKEDKTFFINKYGINIIKKYNLENINDDIEDNKFQNAIRKAQEYTNEKDLYKANNRVPEILDINSKKYKTNAKISKSVLKKNKFVCEIGKLKNVEHKTFETNKKVQYMEGHHIIPMCAQKDFNGINIDREENICCLCPNCHRAIHYGSPKEKKSRLELLYNFKIEKLKNNNIDITFENLINNYYI